MSWCAGVPMVELSMKTAKTESRRKMLTTLTEGSWPLARDRSTVSPIRCLGKGIRPKGYGLKNVVDAFFERADLLVV